MYRMATYNVNSAFAAVAEILILRQIHWVLGQPTNPDVPNGTFSRRLTYTACELSINTSNVITAIAAQGADKLSTKIWSDKP